MPKKTEMSLYRDCSFSIFLERAEPIVSKTIAISIPSMCSTVKKQHHCIPHNIPKIRKLFGPRPHEIQNKPNDELQMGHQYGVEYQFPMTIGICLVALPSYDGCNNCVDQCSQHKPAQCRVGM